MKWGWIMFLHNEEKDLFRDLIITVSERLGITLDIVEKDYYVTLILRKLAGASETIVFKGGTSLSKAYKVIDRFSEDVDITFTEHIGSARRKKLKYQIMKPISDELEMPIINWDSIESDKDYNHYDFAYRPVVNDGNLLMPRVKVETALMSYAFLVVTKEISNIIYDCLKNEEAEILSDYGLQPFSMKVQTLERTLIDKMFAVCDYYLTGKAHRNSRHLYDIYKLIPCISDEGAFFKLIDETREQRARMDPEITPSAQPGINVSDVVQKVCETDFYKEDYEETTKLMISDNVKYGEVIDFYQQIMTKYFA